MYLLAKIILACLLWVCLQCPVASQTYKWKDKDGNTVISTTPPPPGIKSQQNRIEGNAQGSKTAPKVPSKPDEPEAKEEKDYSDIKVLMYMTDWCPVCRKAEVFLKSLDVDLVEYDVEKDPDKEREFLRKVSKWGVPTLDIDGTILQGFSEAAIRAALDGVGRE